MLALLVGAFFMGCASEMGRGSATKLYTIADTLEVRREDIGKDIQLKLDQNLFFNLQKDEPSAGQWELVDYERRILLLLSDSPRTASGYWRVLFQGRSFGEGEVVLRFTPDDKNQTTKDVTFEVLVSK